MTEISLTAPFRRMPIRLSAVAFGGIAWNAFGAVQFAGSVTATVESLTASGLTAGQAAIMTGHPLWMTLAFGLGVACGLAGSLLLLLRHRLSRPVLGVSLAAYLALWVGDAVHGVFSALGVTQVVILTIVVAIAAALFAASRLSAARA